MLFNEGNVKLTNTQLDFVGNDCNRTGPVAHLRIFSSFQSESSKHSPGRRKHEETRVGARRGFLVLRYEAGPEFYRKLARILSQNHPRFSALFPTPRNWAGLSGVILTLWILILR